jgi:4-hydroxy-tetrahydrodipicolinate reductase
VKVALLGVGKTGSKVLALHDRVTAFNRANPVTLEKLVDHDVVISFLPGPAFYDLLDLLVATKLPVITGSTGFTWPENFNLVLEQRNLLWIKSHNFSLGMNIIENMIKQMKQLHTLYPEAEFKLQESHHQHKVDAPSGTALNWQQWLGIDLEISSIREGDTVGIHELTFESPLEKILLKHTAKDRSLFAYGALWAAKVIHSQNLSLKGLIPFNNLVETYLTKKEF